jgi:hypothetical protein
MHDYGFYRVSYAFEKGVWTDSLPCRTVRQAYSRLRKYRKKYSEAWIYGVGTRKEYRVHVLHSQRGLVSLQMYPNAPLPREAVTDPEVRL